MPVTRVVELPAPDHRAMAESLAAKTVALVTMSSKGQVRAYCSGVWVSPSLILTANHCVPDLEMQDVVEYVVKGDVYAGSVPVERADIQSHGALLVLRDEPHDLALLRALAPPSHQTAELSTESIVPGMPVQAMGAPLGLWFSYSSAEVAAVRVIDSALGVPMLFIQATVAISPGSSGGGLYDDWGALIGITHGSFNRGQTLNLFIHQGYIEALMKAARKQGLG